MLTRNQIRVKVEEEFPALLAKFVDILQIPSVNAEPEHRHDVGRSALMVRQWFLELGLESSIHVAELPGGGPGAPAVIATTERNPNWPTVLLYAHHDVQPVKGQSGWTLDPFTPEIRPDGGRGRIYGRGTADDKGGIVAHLGALLALGHARKVNVVVLIEGEEEIGSPSLPNFLERYRQTLEADVVFVIDGNMWRVDTPMMTASMRGLLVGDIALDAFTRGLHSGGYGGPVLDANILLAQLLATLHTKDGLVAVEGLDTGMKPQSVGVTLDPEYFRSDATLLPESKLHGADRLEETLWVKPSISVIGIDATPTDAAPGVLAPHVKARVSLRLPPDLPPQDAIAAFDRHLQENRPHGAKVTFTPKQMAQGYRLDLASRATKQLTQALEQSWEGPAVAAGVGGTVPLLQQVASAFPGAQILKVGTGDPDSKPHGEDESASLDVLYNLIVAETLFLDAIGRAGNT